MSDEAKRPTRDAIVDDIRLSVEEAAEWWYDLNEEIKGRLRERDLAAGKLLRFLESAQAQEIAVPGFLVQRVESWGSYEWDLALLKEEARPLLTPAEWEKAVKVTPVPATTSTTVVTASMKAALNKKGSAGLDVMARAMKRVLTSTNVKVERLAPKETE